MKRDIQLDPIEARLFGVLIEKALTTPEQYPLSVNAATNGANQKSNRHPVLSLSEDVVDAALERLAQKYLARKVFPGSGRIDKYCHNGRDGLGVNIPELAILAELLMRGPQSPGELRTRVSRMSPIESLEQLQTILATLIDDGYVRRLPPSPGSRAERHVQLLSPDLHPLDEPGEVAVRRFEPHESLAAPGLAGRVDTLEAEVARLRRLCEELAAKLGVPVPQAE